LPLNYVSGTELGTSTSTWNDLTLEELGWGDGSYTWSWGTGENQKFTLVIGQSGPAAEEPDPEPDPGDPGNPVPEPAPWTMLAVGLGGLALTSRRRMQNTGRANVGSVA
jgi:hypothetical protein